MSTIYDAATGFKDLMGYEYKIIVGAKGKTSTIQLRFDEHTFFHLCGLHKLTDVFETNENRIKVFNKILDKTILNDRLAKSEFYMKEFVYDRINLVADLSSILNHNITDVYKYNNNVNPNSRIKGDFIIESITPEKRVVSFVIKKDQYTPNKFFGLSIFSRSQEERKFSAGHTHNTLLYISKTPLTKNGELEKDKEIVLYKLPSYNPQTGGNINIVKFSPISEHTGGTAVLTLARPSFRQTVASLWSKFMEYLDDKCTENKRTIEQLHKFLEKRTKQLSERNEEIAALKKENTELNSEIEKLGTEIKALKAEKTPVKTAAQTKSFLQGLDEFAERQRAQNAKKNPIQPNKKPPRHGR